MDMSITPEKTYTLEQFIKSKPLSEISYDLLSVFQKIDDIYIITYNVLDDYRKELFSLTKNVILSEDDFEKYEQAPQLLAYDIYGSTELFFIILYINKMYDIKQFKKKTIKLLYPDALSKILSQIYKSEEPTLTKLKNKIK